MYDVTEQPSSAIWNYDVKFLSLLGIKGQRKYNILIVTAPILPEWSDLDSTIVTRVVAWQGCGMGAYLPLWVTVGILAPVNASSDRRVGHVTL